jgi:glutathione S-transferase
LRRIEQTRGFVSMDWRPDTAVDDPAGLVAEA